MRATGRAARVLVLALPIAAGLSCSDATAPVDDPPAHYITVRRAWNPGERAALIASVMASHAWVVPGVGDLSGYASNILADTDSVTVMITNPLYTPPAVRSASVLFAPQFAGTWNITGLDIWEINNTVAPPDTLRWVGVFWSNPAEANWVGFALAFSRAATVAQTRVNTTTFNAANGKSGAAAGEARNSNGTYWEDGGGGSGSNNTITVSSATYGAASTVTTGPFLGGTSANGSMQGRLRQLLLPRVSGASAPVTDTVDVNFSSTPITSVQFVCKFPTPCTTNAPILGGLR